MRWVGTRKSAATVGPGYLAFGLGRWACPGRFLAVNGMFLFEDKEGCESRSLANALPEIKSWILALVKHSKFTLKDGTYKVVDPCNITGVPPLGKLLLERHAEE